MSRAPTTVRILYLRVDTGIDAARVLDCMVQEWLLADERVRGGPALEQRPETGCDRRVLSSSAISEMIVLP